MLQFYIDHALHIRVVAYVILCGYFIYWSASLASTGQRAQAVILLLVSFFWAGSLHYALLADQRVPLYVFTPTLLLLVLCCVFQMAIKK